MDTENESKFKVECVDLEENNEDSAREKDEEQKVKKEEPPEVEECFVGLEPQTDIHSDGDDWKPPDSPADDKENLSDSSNGGRRYKMRKRKAPKKRGRKKGAVKEQSQYEPVGKKPLLPDLYCYMCPKKYQTAHMFNRHLNEHYSNRGLITAGEYPCKVRPCGKIFTTRKFLESHMRIHEIEKAFDCKVCGRSFSTSKIAAIHRKTHNNEKKFNCEVCCASFVFENALTIHVEQHIKELPFPEELLTIHVMPAFDDNTKTKPGINQELLTGGILYKCSQCPMKFATFNDRRNHQNRDHPKMMTCELCGKVLRSVFAYRLHMVIHTKEKPFKCKFCGEGFASPTLVMVHKRVAHGTGDRDKLYRPHQCETCGKAYVFRYSLTEHINFKHKNIKLICDLCGHSYGTKSRLKRHFKKVHLQEKITGPKTKMRRGQPIKPANCPECEFIAPRQCDLRDHRIKAHFNNLHCDECNISIENILMYKRHADDHREGISVVPGPGRHGQIFGCLRCDKFYTDRRFLREHINTVHNSITFTCDHCEMTFQTKRALIRHLSGHHGVVEKAPRPRKVQGLKMEPPQSSPLALQMPHQSPHSLPAAPATQTQATPPPQNFKVERQVQYPYFANI
ncbi:zinc finger protein 62 homolog isoform X2 [Phlebotomus papatasi]|uniref:zinc finger protein 62 homolog isoform X2 n=1 Tax=Phlebotomus papatasi TaxID=29031 RepID=UPI0024835C40|nr:zinc finger protein 62 homolog isoform X2 [Phlebotomus papatasi]